MATTDIKREAFDKAVEIAKEYARSGTSVPTPDTVLEYTYRVILKLLNEINEPSS